MLTPAQRKIEEGHAAAKKRTCPRCHVAFLTRKDKRIHRKNTNFLCSVTVVEELPRHRYA